MCATCSVTFKFIIQSCSWGIHWCLCTWWFACILCTECLVAHLMSSIQTLNALNASARNLPCMCSGSPSTRNMIHQVRVLIQRQLMKLCNQTHNTPMRMMHLFILCVVKSEMHKNVISRDFNYSQITPHKMFLLYGTCLFHRILYQMRYICSVTKLVEVQDSPTSSWIILAFCDCFLNSHLIVCAYICSSYDKSTWKLHSNSVVCCFSKKRN